MLLPLLYNRADQLRSSECIGATRVKQEWRYADYARTRTWLHLNPGLCLGQHSVDYKFEELATLRNLKVCNRNLTHIEYFENLVSCALNPASGRIVTVCTHTIALCYTQKFPLHGRGRKTPWLSRPVPSGCNRSFTQPGIDEHRAGIPDESADQAIDINQAANLL